MTAADTAPRPAGTPPAPGPRTGRVVLGLVLVGLGAAWLLHTFGVVVPWEAILPAVLVVIGVALLATAHRGASGGLVAAGVIVSVLVIVSSLLTFPFTGRLAGVGDVDHRPTTVEAVADGFALGVGSLAVDLRALPIADEPVTVEAGVGIGELVIRVPPDAAVDVHARTGMGEVVVAGRSRGGVGVELRERLEGEGPVLSVEASTGIGKVEVRR
jgi:hypothetical protein